MSRPALSEKQLAVYNFLVKSLAGGIPPTVREICQETSIKSTSTVHAILNWLEENGYIERDPRFSRSIRIAGTQNTAQIPVIGRVTAGQPILAVEEIEDYIPYATNDSEGLFALRVVGYSMRDVGIMDGDIVYIREQPEVENGQIAAVLIDGDATLKRVYYHPNMLILHPENPADKELIYRDAELENVRILGRAVSFTSAVR